MLRNPTIIYETEHLACENKQVGEACNYRYVAKGICQQFSRTRTLFDGSVFTQELPKECVLSHVRTALPIGVGLLALGLGVFLARRLGRHDTKGTVEIPHRE